MLKISRKHTSNERISLWNLAMPIKSSSHPSLVSLRYVLVMYSNHDNAKNNHQ